MCFMYLDNYTRIPIFLYQTYPLFKWGIDFDREPYLAVDKGARKVEYTNRGIIEDEILKKLPHYADFLKTVPKALSELFNSMEMAQTHIFIRTKGQFEEVVARRHTYIQRTATDSSCADKLRSSDVLLQKTL